MKRKNVQITDAEGCPIKDVFIESGQYQTVTDINGRAVVLIDDEAGAVGFSLLGCDPITRPFFELANKIVINGCKLEMPAAQTAGTNEPPVTQEDTSVPINDNTTPAISEIPQKYVQSGFLKKHWGKLLAAGMVTAILFNDNSTENGN